MDAEAVAQRRGEQPGARGRADQRERRQVERDDPRARALADGDRQLAVLHRRVEGLLQRARQAVDLVDEEDAARLERGQERGDVALALERRAGGLHERDVELVRRRSGRATSCRGPGGPGEQHVVERLAAGARRLDEDRELVLDRALADEVLERARAQRAVELLVGPTPRRSGAARRPVCGCRSRHRAAFSARGDQVLGRLAVGAVEQLVGLLRRVKPRPTRPSRASVRGSSDRVTTISSADAARDLLAQLDDDPLGGALADPGHGLEARRVAGGDRVQELARRAAGQDRRAPPSGPTPWTPISMQEELALLLGREAVELHARRRASTRCVCSSDLLARAAGPRVSVSAETASR